MTTTEKNTVSPHDPGNVGSKQYPFLMRDEAGTPMRSQRYDYFYLNGLVHSMTRHHNWMVFVNAESYVDGRGPSGLTAEQVKTVLSNRDGRACACIL